MSSPAALDGISQNGLKWIRRLPVKPFIPDDIPNTNVELDEPFKKLIEQLTLYSTSPALHKDFRFDLTKLLEKHCLMDYDLVINPIKDVDKELFIAVLNDLYDICDYWRVLIV